MCILIYPWKCGIVDGSVWFNLSDLVEGFLAYAKPGGLWWEGSLGGFGESFYYVIACFYGNAKNLRMVFSSSMRGEVSTLWYLYQMMALPVSGTNLRRVRDVDMKRDYAFVVCISLPILLSFLFKLFLEDKMIYARILSLYLMAHVNFASVIFFLVYLLKHLISGV